MKFASSILLYMLLANPCFAQNKLDIKNKYCIEHDSYNDMVLVFQPEANNIYVYYINVIDDGNFINGFVDSLDYAGVFAKDSIKDSKVELTIKNYRDADDEYKVNIEFLQGGKLLTWEVSSDLVAYLPRRAKFKQCR